MNRSKFSLSKVAMSLAAMAIASNTYANVLVSKTITFDDAIDGQTSYLYDADSDGINDVIFSTTDPFGFNTSGPGPQQLFVNEPGLEGTTTLTPDLRIDLLRGSVNEVSFGFATISQFPGVVQVFDASHNQIGNSVFAGDFFDVPTENCEFGGGDDEVIIALDAPCQSAFPEGEVIVPFDGTAAYVTIDFDSEFAEYGGGRYIIDDFSFTEAGDDILDIFEGGDPAFPVLPDPFDPNNPEFVFELDIIEDGLGTRFPIFIDPIIAVGYDYVVNSGPLVETILIPAALPNGDSDFTVEIAGSTYNLAAGVTFDVFAETGIAGGISEFKILDISTDEALDPTDDMAFNTGLTFVSAGTVDITQTPITIDTDAAQVPLPASGLLFISGLGLLLLNRRKS